MPIAGSLEYPRSWRFGTRLRTSPEPAQPEIAAHGVERTSIIPTAGRPWLGSVLLWGAGLTWGSCARPHQSCSLALLIQTWTWTHSWHPDLTFPIPTAVHNSPGQAAPTPVCPAPWRTVGVPCPTIPWQCRGHPHGTSELSILDLPHESSTMTHLGPGLKTLPAVIPSSIPSS